MTASSSLSRRLVLGAAALGWAVVAAVPAAGQDDVAALGAVYGTPVPESHRAFMARNPDAFRFDRALFRRNPRLELVDPGTPGVLPPTFRAAGADGRGPAPTGWAPLNAIGPRERAVEGTFAFPVILGYFADDASAPSFDRDRIQQEYFDGPNSYYRTVPEYFDEISGGRVHLEGVTFAWQRSTLTREETAAGLSGLGGSRVGEFIRSVLAEMDDGSIDWGRFDNDGPDGIPNSGDDDGFVDVLTVVHPTHGAECGGSGNDDRIWSHRWNLSSASGGLAPYTTATPAAGGGQIRINDYTIQPVLACDARSINQIGVFAHELGHGFGLPDLYCTASGCPANGIGTWGLMGQGAWGCGPTNPALPCHMSAWSKAMLGWVDVQALPPGRDHGRVTIPPVQTSGRVVRIDALDGSGDYYLLENRRRTGFDVNLAEEGLLVWHVDPNRVAATWSRNRVNFTPGEEGVGLVQADGRLDLANGYNRSDAGDVFPGATDATAFHAGTSPASVTRAGSASAVTLLDIGLEGDDVTLRIVNRRQTVELRTQGTDGSGLVAVDGRTLPRGATSFFSAPFETHRLSAAPGEELAVGIRRAFEGWADDASAPRERTVVTGLEDAAYTAVYGSEEVRVEPELTGGALGVAPGSLAADPAGNDFWFPTGSEVRFTAIPAAGFTFLDWGGALRGRTNPLTLTLDGPVSIAADFGLSFQALVQPLLVGSALDPALATALDGAGNRNGGYDVGDLRAYLLGGPGDLAPQEVEALIRAAAASGLRAPPAPGAGPAARPGGGR
jgi:M6 family metalloprotease-like protein